MDDSICVVPVGKITRPPTEQLKCGVQRTVQWASTVVYEGKIVCVSMVKIWMLASLLITVLVGVCTGDRATIKPAEEKAVSEKEQSTGPGDEDVTMVGNKPSTRKRKSENGAKERKIHNKVSI